MIKDTFKGLLKKIGIVLSIYLVIGVIYIICVQFNKIRSYERGTNNEDSIKLSLIYNDTSISKNDLKSDDLSKFISCYQKPIEQENFTKEMINKYEEIENLFNNSSEKVSFSYEDIYTGLHISYNENQTYFAASAIKNAVVIYVYKLYTEGKIDLNEMLTYTSSAYVGGSGYIQYQPLGSTYSINNLVKKTIIDSDNVAYTMLSQYTDKTDIRDYWKKLGADYFWSGSIWGSITSHDGAIYMKQLYNFTKDNPEIEDELISYYLKSVARLIQLNDQDIKIAHKSGWNSATVHDTAIIYSKQPYILAITSLKGYSNYSSFFKDASVLVNEFHNLYWEKKIKECYQEIFSKNN